MIDKTLLAQKDKIVEHVESRLQKFKKGKQLLDRLFYTAILFYRGEQWVTFDMERQRFRRTNQRRVIPRPVTNKYAPTVNAIISSLLRFDPKIVFAPQTDTREDMVTALAGNRVVKTIENEVVFEKRKTELVPWVALTGNPFIITGFDPEEGARILKVWRECPACHFRMLFEQQEPEKDCPTCADAGVKSPMKVMLNEKTGQPDMEEEAQGRMTVDIASPFEMFLDYRIPEIQDHNTIIRICSKDVEWAKHRWPDVADKIEPHKRPELNARILNALSNIVFPSEEQSSEEQVDIVVCWEKPSQKFKDGFYVVYSQDGAVIHELVKFPYRTNRGVPFFPIVHVPYDKVPGSLLARTPAFDLIEKQKTRNRVEALGEMILMRMSNPVWLRPVPGTSSQITGHVGQVIDYDPNMTAGHAPTRVDASNMPPAIVAWLDRIDRDFAEISAQFEVARGERPLSVKSGDAIGRLREIANDRNMALFTNFSIALAEWQQQAFEIFRQVTPGARYSRILGEDAAWTVTKVKEADLKGGVDIWAEPGSSTPKSHLERLATLEFMVQMGFINPQDPMVRLRVLREYGVANILPGMDADDQYIAREHDRFKRTGKIAVSPFDNHVMHLERHLAFWKSELFETLPMEVRQIFLQHIIEHQQWYQQQMMQQVAAQQSAQGPGNGQV